MKAKWVYFFLFPLSALLLGDGMVRCAIALGKSPLLGAGDPLLGISLQPAVLVVGIIEIAVAGYILFGQRIGLQSALLAWVGTNYLVYRMGLFWMGAHLEWSCVGSLTDPLHLARGPTGFVKEFVLPAVLVVGGYAALAGVWWSQRMSLAAAFEKMFCPSCGGHIKFALENQGQRLPCPHCQTSISLRKPENLKMSCFFCQGHIAFPAHALGTKMPCPHCQKDITLLEPK